MIVLHRLAMGVLFLMTVTAFAGGIALHLRGDEAFVVLSGSMRPGMPVGSVVVTGPVPAERIRRGDVITFHPPGRADIVVTHRVIAIEQPAGDPQARFITRGDANPAPDPWAIPALGTAQRLVFHLPSLGYVLAAIQTRPGKAALMLGPALMLAGGVLIEIWRGHPRERES
jgi:signal peptidase